jgi:DNA replication and repair protein RecF
VLHHISLTSFRNHRETLIGETRQFNLLVGENGAGKTNVLEAVSLLAPGRGLRRAALADMAAQLGPGGFAVSARLASGDSEPVRLGTGTEAAHPGRRVVHVNGATSPANRLAEWLSIGWLTPAMDRLFSESAGARRRFLDRLVLAFAPGHAASTSRLEAALRERNRLLSDPREPDPHWLDGIEAQLAQAGAAVAGERARTVERLNAMLETLPSEPFALPRLAYQPGGPLEVSALADALRQGRAQDRAAGRTLTGPHRDELAVTMAGKDQPAAECSTGEQKAMLISIVLAHSRLLEADAATRRPRVLLLDEVAAHLDPLRREALFERLREGRAQIWLTGTERAPFAAIEGEMAVWEVRGGEVARVA